MTRADLERLDREDLVLRAEAAGVTRARILTRAELVDELVLRSNADLASKQKARGLFGRARDLLARVVEQGLHLPDAADRIRALGGMPPPRPGAPAALPTVTLAEIYAAQGHRARAVETLERVLAREPEHAAAAALLAQLRDAAIAVPPARPFVEDAPTTLDDAAARVLRGARSTSPDGATEAAPESQALEPAPGTLRADAPSPSPPAPAEPSHMLDDAPLPPRYDVDECVAIPVDPTTLFVYWEVRASTLDYVRASRPDGALSLRVIVIVPTWDGPRSSIRDHDVHTPVGDFFVRELPPMSVVRVAIGHRQGDAFVSIAHSPALETPPGGPAAIVADALVRWTPHGSERIGRRHPEAPPLETTHRPRRGAGALMDPNRHPPRSEPVGAFGSSEQWGGRDR